MISRRSKIICQRLSTSLSCSSVCPRNESYLHVLRSGGGKNQRLKASSLRTTPCKSFHRFQSTAISDAMDELDNDYFSISIENDGQTVSISTVRNDLDGDEVNLSDDSWEFPSPLLWVNDPQYVHATSGQRLRSLGQYSRKFAIVRAQILSTDQASFVEGVDDNGTTNLYPTPPQGSMHSRGGISYYLFADSNHDKNISSRNLLKVWWNYGGESIFDLEWLVDHARNNCLGRSFSSQLKCDEDTIGAYPTPRRQKERCRTTATAVTKDIAIGAMSNPKSVSISKFDYKETMEKESTLYEAMRDIFEHGAILVQNAPDVGEMTNGEGDAEAILQDANSEKLMESIVGDLGRRFSGGHLSHGSLYGDIFHVKSKHNAENIAYTNVALPPHQDLTYYESKPFLQLLHCATATKDNNNCIVGGESVLIDGMAAAEELRRISPDLFDVLLDTEATFIKERYDADMVSPKRHIVVDRTCDQVVELNWSPPFEGPLQMHPSVAVEEYVRAYQALEIMLDDSWGDMNCNRTLLPLTVETLLREYAKAYTWERPLKAGEILVFNNQRMLHGRRSFRCIGTVQRHLIGCYTDAIDTTSRYRQLLRDKGWKCGGGYGRRNPGSGCRWM